MRLRLMLMEPNSVGLCKLCQNVCETYKPCDLYRAFFQLWAAMGVAGVGGLLYLRSSFCIIRGCCCCCWLQSALETNDNCMNYLRLSVSVCMCVCVCKCACPSYAYDDDYDYDYVVGHTLIRMRSYHLLPPCCVLMFHFHLLVLVVVFFFLGTMQFSWGA